MEEEIHSISYHNYWIGFQIIDLEHLEAALGAMGAD